MPILPIAYEFMPGCEVMPNDRIEEILRIGKVFSLQPDADVIFEIVGGEIKYDSIDCVRCVMDGGLMAVFYPETSFAKFASREITVESLARRYRAAYEVSKRFGVEVCPIAVIRSLPGLGRGLIIPVIVSKALVFVQMIEGRPRAAFKGSSVNPERINEAMLFDYCVGSGQKSWYGYQVDKNGKVYSPYHFLAFTHSAAGKLAGILARRKCKIRSEFFQTIERFFHRQNDLSALVQELMLLVDVVPVRTFHKILVKLLEEHKLGDHVRVELTGP